MLTNLADFWHSISRMITKKRIEREKKEKRERKEKKKSKEQIPRTAWQSRNWVTGYRDDSDDGNSNRCFHL